MKDSLLHCLTGEMQWGLSCNDDVLYENWGNGHTWAKI